MNPNRLSLLFVPLFAASALLAQQTTTVPGTVKKLDPTDRNAKPPVSAQSDQVTLEKGEGPAGVTDAWRGTATIGKAKVAIVVGKNKADAEMPNVVCVDLDGNGKFEANEMQALDVSKRQSRGPAGKDKAETKGPDMLFSKPVDVALKLGGSTLDAKVSFAQTGEKPMVSLSFVSYLEATVQVGSEQRIVAVVDKDLDGKFGSAGDLWTLAKPGDRPTSAYAMTGFGEHHFENGKSVSVEVAGTEIKVTMADAAGPDPKDLAAQRHRADEIWTERFDKERADFVKQREVDTTRPKAKKPIEWRYVTFAQGLEMAKKEQKPLFVDVMAFWCVWCYRMDYYTYCDQEVADLMNGKFIPVKILQEQDAAGDYKALMEKMEAKGIPAMAIFDADGKVVHKISGWKKAQEFIEELKKGVK